MKNFTFIFLLLLIVFTIYSCHRKNQLPIYTNVPQSILKDPKQQPTSRPCFTVQINKRVHPIIPLREYEISGLIVSCGFSESLSKYHNDTLNLMDVGLIWGDNMNPKLYKKVKFHTNGVRLFFKSTHQEVWNRFRFDQISNNHLICTNALLRKKIKKLHRGELISIKGFLANYSGRSSSLTRTDQGDGACEVLWVDELTILEDKTALWNHFFWNGIYAIIGLLLMIVFHFFFAPIKKGSVQ